MGEEEAPTDIMASLRRYRKRSCESKSAHPTLEGARLALRIFIRRYQPNEFYQIYKCKFAAHYHIGRTRPPRRR